MDKQQLVKDVTISLYSSLEIEKSLHETLGLLKQHLPLDLLHVFILDVSTNTLRYLAEATIKKGILIDERLVLAPEHFAEFSGMTHGDIRVVQSESSPMLRVIHQHFLSHVKNPLYRQGQKFSVIFLGFDLVPPLKGGIGMVVRGTNVFDKSHVETIKPLRQPLIGAILNLLHHREVVCQNQRLAREKQRLEMSLGHVPGQIIIGAETGLKSVFTMIRQVASLDSPVLICGETGTGKEVVANAIHQKSGRADGPMVRINCGAIPESLIDSELFGHEKGAFTGANRLKQGFFEQADGGTIFLDEVGELPLSAQVKLLRVLQSMEFHRVGGNWPVNVDVRVIAATNRDLSVMVQENRFRQDLWFRLNVFPIIIPPLRSRPQDIEPLTRYFIEKKTKEMNLATQPVLSSQAILQLKDYAWPGNVRELQNVIERALILGRGYHLSFDNLISAPKTNAQGSYMASDSTFFTLDQMIRQHIRSALDICRCKVEGPDGAARLLAINPSTLRSKMKKLGIEIKKDLESML